MFITIGQSLGKQGDWRAVCAKVASTVRRGAGRKGRKDLARSLPSIHTTWRRGFGFSTFLGLQRRYMRGTIFGSAGSG